MVSPLCLVNNTSTVDGYDCVSSSSGNVIRLLDTAGVATWTITCTNTDELSDATTVTAGLTIDSVAKTATFVAPVDGRAWQFKSVVNSGRDANGPNATYTAYFAIYTLQNDNRVGFVNETIEGDHLFGTVSKFNPLLRQGITAGSTFAVPVVLQGTPTAHSGDLRGANARTILAVRNATDDADIGVISTDASNNVVYGGANAASIRLQSEGTNRLIANSTDITLSMPLVLQGGGTSTTGDIRAGNSSVILSARTALDNADLPIIQTDGSDNRIVTAEIFKLASTGISTSGSIRAAKETTIIGMRNAGGGGDTLVLSGLANDGVALNSDGYLFLEGGNTPSIVIGSGKLSFFDVVTPIAKPTVTGSVGGNAAITSLCAALASLGLITNSTS